MTPQVMITRVPHSVLRSRIDSGFYAPEHLERERSLRQLGVLRPTIGETASLVTDGTHKTPNYVENGVPFLSATNIYDSALTFADHRFISSAEFLQLRAWNCAPLPNDVVVAKSGSIGNAAVVPSHAPEFAVFESVAIVRCARFDPYYLATFLNSRIGQQEIKRQTKGAVIRHLHLEDLREVEVPEFSQEVQRYIGDKVRQAERLRARARSLTALSTLLVESIIDGSMSEPDIIANRARLRHAEFPAFAGPRVNRATSERRHLAFRNSDLDPGRIDPWHHQPRFVEARASIARSGPCMNLGDLIDKARGIRGGATPLGARYPDAGEIRFYRTADVRDLMIHRSSAGFLSFEQDSELARSRLAIGDVLLTITGVNFGQSGVVSPLHLPGNISQHSVRFALSGHDAHYLVAYLSCHYGQQMIWREAYGATRPAIDYPGVAEILVRTPGPKIQSFIGDLVRSLESCTIAGDALVSAAKQLVEGLIEGVISEADLITAQNALEAGDRSADREILRALRQSEAPDAKPLIADVDALYALLDGLEGQVA